MLSLLLAYPARSTARVWSLLLPHISFKMKVSLIFFLAVTASAGSLKDIKHVVLFMQENRAFDHVNKPASLSIRNASNLKSILGLWLEFVDSQTLMYK